MRSLRRFITAETRTEGAVDFILNGGTVFDPVVTRGMAAGTRHGGPPSPLAGLTPQETRLLAEVAKGKTDKEVAVALSLTAKTARNYLDRVFAKLGVHTRTEAALHYARHSEGQPAPDFP